MLEKLADPAPRNLLNNLKAEIRVGSIAYGVDSKDSDIDVFGFYAAGKCQGKPGPYNLGFVKYASFHFYKAELVGLNTTLDGSFYDYRDFIRLAHGIDLNLLDSLFVDDSLIYKSSREYEFLRKSRKDFLTKDCCISILGQALNEIRLADPSTYREWFSYLKKKQIDNPSERNLDEKGLILMKRVLNLGNPKKRLKTFLKYGVDTQRLYITARLLNQVEQILDSRDMNLSAKADFFRKVKKGQVSYQDMKEYAEKKAFELEERVYNSKLPETLDLSRFKLIHKNKKKKL